MSDEREGLRRLIDAARTPEFSQRLVERIRGDSGLLHRLSSCTSNSAHLVESRDGGSVLVYRCDECGARLFRTREQADAQAITVDGQP